MKMGREGRLYLSVAACIVIMKALDYSFPVLGVKPAHFQCTNAREVLLATGLDAGGVLLIAGPIFLLAWNALVTRVFGLERINLLKAWTICFFGLLFSAFLGR